MPSFPPISIKTLELDTLLDITNAINRQQDEDSLLKIFLFTLVANFKINKLAVYSREVGGWKPVLLHGLPTGHNIPQPILMQIGKNHGIISVKKRLPDTVSTDFDVMIPVGRESRNVAIVLLGGLNRLSEQESSESLKFIQTIANILTVAIQNIRLNHRRLEQQAIKKEIELAKKLQSQLFPSFLPKDEKLHISSTYLPQLMVGGDYYDYIPLNENEFLLCIADVSGKGVPAAFIMSNLQSALRILSKQNLSLTDIVSGLNELVFENAKGEKFITFFIAKYNLQTYTIEYINCGHNDPVIFFPDGNYQNMHEGTLMLGAFEKLPFISSGTVHNVKGTYLFAYTDGLTESFDRDNADNGLKIAVDIICEHLVDFQNIHRLLLDRMDTSLIPIDDITMLSCRVG